MKHIALIALALTIVAASQGCKKDSNTSTNTTHNDTTTLKCRYMEGVSYNASNVVTYRAKYIYSGKRLDSIISTQIPATGPSTTSVITYTYASDYDRSYHVGSGAYAYTFRELLDNQGNVIRTEINYDSHPEMNSYSTTTYSCL